MLEGSSKCNHLEPPSSTGEGCGLCSLMGPEFTVAGPMALNSALTQQPSVWVETLPLGLRQGSKNSPVKPTCTGPGPGFHSRADFWEVEEECHRSLRVPVLQQLNLARFFLCDFFLTVPQPALHSCPRNTCHTLSYP